MANKRLPSSSTSSIGGRTVSVVDLSKLLIDRDAPPACENPAFHRLPTPPPDYDNIDTTTNLNDTTVTIEVYPPIPEPDYDSDDGGNSDITFVIGDVVEDGSSDADSPAAVVGNLSSKVLGALNHPAYRGMPNGLAGADGFRSTSDPLLVLGPSRLQEILAHMEQSSSDSSRIYFSIDRRNPHSKLVRCGIAQKLSWLMAFFFIFTCLVLLDEFYPESPAVWVCLVALVLLGVVGLANYVPSLVQRFVSARDRL